MHIRKLSLALLLALGLAGCGNQATNTQEVEKTEIETATDLPGENKDVADKPVESSSETSQEKIEAFQARLAVLAGPTAAGAINMIDQGHSEDNIYKITETVEGAPDAIVPKLVSGEADIAVIPANLASVLYNKTSGKIKVLAINNLGVLYLIQNGEPTITSLEDLVNSGETIYAPGKGATPELAINQILTSAGYQPEDLKIEYMADASELAQKMIAGEANIALLPEPMVTNVLSKREDASVVLDINELYEDATGSPLVTAVLVARSDYLDTIDVTSLLAAYKESVNKAITDVDGTAALLGQYEIMPEEVAKKALPKLALNYIDGDQMKEKVSKYLGGLFAANPQMIGGELPADDFYYTK